MNPLKKKYLMRSEAALLSSDILHRAENNAVNEAATNLISEARNVNSFTELQIKSNIIYANYIVKINKDPLNPSFDNVPPILEEIVPIGNSIETRPEYTFTSNEDGILEIEGGITTNNIIVKTGSNTITFQKEDGSGLDDAIYDNLLI